MELQEIYKQIELLEREAAALEEEDRKLYCEESKSFIGKCYHYVGKRCYFQITDVPQITYDMQGRTQFNKYQFPALFIDPDDEETPIYYDTVYLNIKIGVPERTPSHFTSKIVEEVPSKEFVAAINAMVEEIVRAVK